MSQGPEDASESSIAAALQASDVAPPEADAPSEETPAVEPVAVETTEPADAAPVETAPAEEAAGEEVAGEAAGTEAGGSEETEDGGFRRYMHDIHGTDTSGYQSDAAFAASCAEAKRLIGHRNESAELGKVAQSLGLDARQLAELTQRQQAPPPAAEEKPPLTFDQAQLLRQELRDPSTGAIREDADPSRVKQYNDYQLRLARAVHILSEDNDADEKIDEKIEDLKKTWQENSQQQVVEQQFVDRAQAFEQANQSWLYKGGKPTQHTDRKAHPEDFTPDGLAFWQEAAVLGERYAIRNATGAVIGNKLDPMEIAELALENFQLKQAAVRKPTRTAKSAAQHRAEPAADTPKLTIAEPPADMEEVQAMAFRFRVIDEARQAQAGALK